MTALSRLIEAKVKELGLSTRDVARLSEKCPPKIGTISSAAVGQYRSGKHPEIPSDRILRVLSWTLDVPLAELRHAAGLRESPGLWTPPAEAHQMNRRQRTVIEDLIKMLVSKNHGDDNGSDVNVIYEGTVDLAEDPPAPHEPSAADREATAEPTSSEPRENGPASTESP